MKSKWLLFAVMLLSLTMVAFGQTGTVMGTVEDANSHEPLIGANVLIQGTTLGSATDADGYFVIENVPAGAVTVEVSFIGYHSMEKEVTIKAGQKLDVKINLKPSMLSTSTVEVVAQRAKKRETPVAFTTVDKIEMQASLGSRDVPLILNTTPGVYATAQGGGAGDSRINIRGFDQRNVAVMINGVPVNDMENGWVYWSNWDGLGDATSSVQVQRGLGAANLAIASVGGTMNIITDVASLKRGMKYKQEYGTGNLFKETFSFNSGLIADKFATSFSVIRKTGDGVVDKTWTDAWAYFGAVSYIASKSHKFDLFVIGAPQRHGQRSYKQEIWKFDKDYAEKHGADVTGKTEYGYKYNPNWGRINASKEDLKEYYNGSIHDPRTTSYIMERENYYHKPQVNLNWYWQVNKNLMLNNVLYYSRGKGGGTGPYGSWTSMDNTGQIDYQTVYENNRNNIDTNYSTTESKSNSIIRNSVNQHKWYGWIGSFDYTWNENLKLNGGIDLRYYIGEHWREVRNLIGGDYYVYHGEMKRLGDVISYHNDGFTRWGGAFMQAEYKKNNLSAYASGAVSQTGYKRKDYFILDAEGKPEETDWNSYNGFNIKGGINYNITPLYNIYFNVGYISKAPIFDAVYNYDNTLYDPTFNEKITHIELGNGYKDRMNEVNANFYYTRWNDRSWPSSFRFTDPNSGETVTNYFLLRGIDALHKGLEIDFKSKIHRMLTIKGALSWGDWKWLNNVNATYSPEEDPTQQKEINVYTKGLLVGDAAQVTFSLSGTLRPVKGSYLTLIFKRYAKNYADFDPADRSNASEAQGVSSSWAKAVQPWKIPNYNVVDLHGSYTLPLQLPNNIRLEAFVHVFNLFDTHYVTDAEDGYDHSANTVEVFMGLPRFFNTGINISL